MSLAARIEAEPTVIAVFSSPWCGPCRALKAALEVEADAAITVVHVDIAEAPQEAQPYGVTATPTMVGFVEGRQVAKQVGFSGLGGLRRFLARLRSA